MADRMSRWQCLTPLVKIISSHCGPRSEATYHNLIRDMLQVLTRKFRSLPPSSLLSLVCIGSWSFIFWFLSFAAITRQNTVNIISA